METFSGTTTVRDYRYDLASRLDQVDINGALAADYGYDSNSNRTSVTRGSGASATTETGTYDAQDRMASYGGFTFTHTANGEQATRTQTSSGAQFLTVYDSHGNLKQATLPDGRTVAYLSDGFHRRVQKRINGTLVQQLIYLDQLEPYAELDGAGNVVATFVYADRSHVPTLMRKNGRWYRIVSDPLGSVRLVVDLTDGAILQRMDYDEFGRVLLDSSPGFQPFGFAGGLYDRDTGLVRFGARDYDPVTGRWTTKDPARFGGGQNFYLYGWSDPVNTLDVNGEVPVVLIAGAMSYARCVATCTALEGLLTALSGECDLDLPDLTGDCALDCLNPLNWAGIGKAGDLMQMAKRSQAAKRKFLRDLASDPNTPSWQREWVRQGRNPPGYDVDHRNPLSTNGPDDPSNMRLVLRADHRIHHKFYRPWQ